ncbi:MAG: serine/threonine-protein kinase [Kofleriaceae bacterium]
MASTPAQRFVCPRCRTSFEQPSHFCRECGADMTRASALDAAVRDPISTSSSDSQPVIDRRLTDSNQAWLGRIVDGRYRVIEVIGRGGMGVVYRVEHLRMGKIAAMKVLHRDLAQDPDVIARFEREAAAVSRLFHPHTVQVFDFGTTNGALYLIMELVRGQDLARIIERDGPMPWARAAPLLAQICGALQEAHELGIVHRDLKPENVLITRSTAGRDYAKVLDFGLAKLEQPQAPKRETERQAIVGTPYFMAPEQIRGDDVDARTDIYSFGALMFELLTGEHLYSGSTAVGVLTKHLTAEPDAPSMRTPRMGIPPEVDHLCRKALARSPEDRWQSAAELGEAIEEIYRETVTDTTGQKAGGSRALAGGRLAVADESTESDLRLRRSDIDSYEASIKRRRWLVIAMTMLLVAGATALAMWFATRPPALLTAEREPNDELADANAIAANVPVTGYLGRRYANNEGDRDIYRVDFPAGSHRIVTVTVTGLPNLDVNLAVSDRQGLHAVKIDEGGNGDDEILHRRAVEGPLVITIGQTLPKDSRFPVENVSDPYTVTVTEEKPGGETEPNGNDADANPLVLSEQLKGYLDTREDVDLLRWTGADGTYNVTLYEDGVSIAWSIANGAQRTAGLAKLELHRGDIIRIERSPKPPTKRNATWAIVVTPA